MLVAHSLLVLPLVPVVLASAAIAPAAQGTRINPRLESIEHARVDDVLTSPDGRWVVYKAREAGSGPGVFSAPVDGSGSSLLLAGEPDAVRVEVSNRWVVLNDWSDLWVAPIDGSRPAVRILGESQSLDQFRLAADVDRVVFTAWAGGDSGWELFSIPVDGSGPPVSLGTRTSLFQDFLVSPDGRRVVWIADAESPDVHELWSAPVDGSASAVKLSGALVPGGDVAPPSIGTLLNVTPDSTRVTFQADQDVDDVVELYVVPIDGSAPPVKLSDSLVAGGDVREHRIAPDGARVLYLADQESDEDEELWSVPLDGTAPPVKVNGALGEVTNFAVGPDGRFVVYRAGGFTQRIWFAARADGTGTPLRLAVQPLGSFEFSADGARIVYEGNRQARMGLYSVGLARGGWVELTGSLASAQLFSSHQTTLDGAVVYFQRVGGVLELRRIPVTGGVPLVLTRFSAEAAPTWIGPTGSLRLTPDRGAALALVDRTASSAFDLLALPVSAPREGVVLNAPLLPGLVLADVTEFDLAPDGRTAVFTVYTPGDDVHEVLYRVELGAAPVAEVLFQRPDFTVGQPTIHGPTGRVVFRAGNDWSEVYDLWSTPLDGSAPEVRLNDPATSDYGVGPFLPSPDGAWVVFESYHGDDGHELHAAPLAGGPQVDVSGDLVEGGNVFAFRITADSSRVVYAADQLANGRVELFGAVLGAGAPPVALSGARVPGGDVLGDFVLGPNGTRVVYRADAAVDDLVELWSAPTDGSAPPVRLSGVLGATGDVRDGARVAPDGLTVVFAADAAADELVELFAAPVDGSAAPIALGGPLQGGEYASGDFELTPDGTQVVFRADALEDERFELFIAPLDGSAPPRRVSGALVGGGDVAPAGVVGVARAFRLSPDGKRVVYRADGIVDERFELFGALLGSVAEAVALSGVLDDDGDVVGGFEVTPDSTRVVFGADRAGDDAFELLAAPLDRPKEVRRLNAPLVAGGDAALGNLAGPTFRISADSKRVLYRADQEIDEVVELFLSFLDGPHHTGAPSSLVD